jgi:hypothetical protein
VKTIVRNNRYKDIDKLDNFADVILDNMKQNAKIYLSDGLDKEELFQGLKDLSRQQQQQQQQQSTRF